MKKNSKSLLLIIIFLLFFLLGGLFYFLYRFPVGDGWDFRNNLWSPAYLLIHGQNPYDIKRLFPDSNAIWLPPVIGIFSFLGLFTFDTARTLWLLINMIAFFTACFLIIHPIHSPNEFIWFILLALFPSTIINFTMGQFSIMSLFLMLLLARLHHHLPLWAKGVIIALLLAKPQLIIFSLPVFLYHLTMEKGFKTTLIQTAWIIAGVVVSSLPLFFEGHHWASQLFANLRENSQWLQPNISSLFVQRFGFPPLFSVFLIMIGLGFSLYYSSRHKLYDSISVSLAITPLLSPYIWSWDFVLLFPFLINSYKNAYSKVSRLIILGGYLGIAGLFSAFKMAGLSADELYIWVTPALLILLSLAKVLQNKPTPTTRSIP